MMIENGTSVQSVVFSSLLSYFWFAVLKQYQKKLRLACKAGASKLYGREKD